MKYSEDTAKRWFDGTFDLICAYLDMAQIPYIPGTMRTNGDIYNDSRQIRFPWCKGDVVIGCLHATDIDILNGTIQWQKYPYPSIETYRFPWDEGDITVFDTPVEFIEKLAAYFFTKKHTENCPELEKAIDYLDWYFETDEGAADKNAEKAWDEVRKSI